MSQKSIPLKLSCSMRTDGWTGMTKLVLAFHNFANAPRNITQNRGRSLKV